MTPAQGRENVAVFNPIVLALPNWHPDGPDGDVDGYVILFVMPAPPDAESLMNRAAKLRVFPTAHGWRAELFDVHVHAETADQARAFAGAWIRAAEVLEAIEGRAKKRPADVEVQDVEHNGAAPAGGCPACTHGSCTLHSDEVKPT